MSFSPTAPFSLTTWSVSTASTAATDYKQAIDNDMIVAQRMGTPFAVTELSPSSLRAMQVKVAAGWLFDGVTFTEITAQTSPLIAAPLSASRIDRLVASALTGAISVVGGTEAAVPAAPTIPVGSVPLARIALAVGVTRIGNSMLTDERAAVWGQSLPGDYQEFTSTGTFTWNKPIWASTSSLVVGFVWASGAAGGSGDGSGSGGGGACTPIFIAAGALSTAVSVVVPAGGLGTAGTFGANGSLGSFGPFTAYPGAGGSVSVGGGGGGVLGPGATNGTQGAPLAITSNDNAFGGGQANAPGGSAVYGGGGGAQSGGGAAGGNSVYGGAGGGGGNFSLGSNGQPGGASVFGGNGGKGSSISGVAPVAGSAPGGAGGGSANSSFAGGNGARGEARIWTLR